MENKWLIFAYEDLQLARLANDREIFNQVCFHSQQGLEKLIKAFISFNGAPIPKTHSLSELLRLAKELSVEFPDLEQECLILDTYYIPTRYPDALPGMSPDGMPGKSNASEALNILENCYQIISKFILKTFFKGVRD